LEKKDKNMDDELDVIGGSVSEEHQYLTFIVSGETFAIAVLEIKEIIEYASITHVPQMYSYMAGVTNVRGNVIPVIDFKDRLGLGHATADNRTCIIVETVDESETLLVGLIVETVDQVYPLPPEVRELAPNFGTRIGKDFISSMAKVNDRFITILNLSALLDVEELSKNKFAYETR
jgi:purine-binding chemotaxis protein CheW